jgi:hypothetical protein
MTKLAIIPFTMLLETILLNKKFRSFSNVTLKLSNIGNSALPSYRIELLQT